MFGRKPAGSRRVSQNTSELPAAASLTWSSDESSPIRGGTESFYSSKIKSGPEKRRF